MTTAQGGIKNTAESKLTCCRTTCVQFPVSLDHGTSQPNWKVTTTKIGQRQVYK